MIRVKQTGGVLEYVNKKNKQKCENQNIKNF